MKTHRFVARNTDHGCNAILATNVGSSITCNRTLTDPMHDLQREGDIEDGNAFVTVQVSRELLAQLQTWSNPVRVMIIPPIPGDDHHQMIFERHECEKSA